MDSEDSRQLGPVSWPHPTGLGSRPFPEEEQAAHLCPPPCCCSSEFVLFDLRTQRVMGRDFRGHAVVPLHFTGEETETPDFLHCRILAESNPKSGSTRSVQPFPVLFPHSSDIQVSIYPATPGGTAFSWGPRE